MIKQPSERKNWFLRIIWRLQFVKVKYYGRHGRCTDCDAGKLFRTEYSFDLSECGDYYCPCKMNEQLKRKYTFKFLYEN